MNLKILILLLATAVAMTAKAARPSQLKIVCSGKPNQSVSKALINDCSGEGVLVERVREGKKIILSTNDRDGLRCVITERLAKQHKVPFEMVWDLLETRRAEVVCYYQIPTGGDVEATAFTFRVFLE